MKATQARRKPQSRSMGKVDLLKREKAIIADIKAGMLSYREIAAKHGVSLPTVNNKARKAGISRGRRKGAKIIVAGPARKKAVRKAARKAKKVVRKARRKVAPKAVRRMVAVEAPTARASRPRIAARRRTKRVVRQTSHSMFCADLRELLLKYNRNISLRRYEKIARLVEMAIR